MALLQTQSVVEIRGDDFDGGAKERYGTSFFGRKVNLVYAASNGPLSSMAAMLCLKSVPANPRLYLRARQDETTRKCRVEISLNKATVFSGQNPFKNDGWQIVSFEIPPTAISPGDNELLIRNTEPSGEPGMPPWFMVASAVIAGPDFSMKPDITKDFGFDLPARKRPIPEGPFTGFPIRGIKGWMWKPDQYFAVLPVLKAAKMNFLMNCYTNMCDIEHYRWGDPKGNRWWEPVPRPKRMWLERLVKECQKNDIQFCFSMNPSLCSSRPIRYDSKEDLESLWRHFAWMQSLGVKWFNVSLDDISEGIDADGQVRVVNEIYRRLKEKDNDAKFIFCPTWYWGDGTEKDKRPYLETVARKLDKDIYLFWTGDDVIGPITKKAADSYRAVVKHRLILWDNYPVNDANPAMHLGPVFGRDKDLCETIDGYMSNSMCQQGDANRIPMLTCADYAYNPKGYDPERSIGQAVLNLARTKAERKLLRELVLAYPGFLYFYEGKYITSYDSVREQFQRIIDGKHSRYAAEAYFQRIDQLAKDLKRVYPTTFLPERELVESDLKWMEEILSPLLGIPQVKG